MRPEGDSTRATKEEVPSAEYYHILHNLHDRCLPLDQQEEPGEVKHMPSASELYFAGVKFAPDAPGNNLFKFKFSEAKGLFWMCRRARFVIPPLAIYDDTELYLRNLIAFEQCCPGVPQNVTSYAFVMGLLVNSNQDVQSHPLQQVLLAETCDTLETHVFCFAMDVHSFLRRLHCFCHIFG
ncbi:hypothetical protein RHMOL_Rhmol05G0227700 [Rhododendron molle]|uniref:Uncharacterized protein n=1 Tax=Rhododendron molle TaxID=49168 RepID=A0ACC0NT38_RHOML|nr:hypothetical protein RHMOL_Rhmol05G0227700 [Rhododendron molle]